MNTIYKAIIQDTTFEIDLQSKQTLIDGKPADIKLCHTAGNSYTFSFQGNERVADVVKIDPITKQVTLRIAGKKYALQVKEPVDLQLEKLGINTLAPKKINQLKAPMPGLVLKILVSEGDQVNTGDPLMVLEAMKMENVFKATAPATIKAIRVEAKQAVEKGQELIAFA